MKFVEPIREIKKIAAIKKVLENKRDVLLVTLGINSALRISDMLKLTVKDVMQSGKVRDEITIKENKTGKSKNFPLNESVKKAIEAYLFERDVKSEDEPLFLSRKNGEAIRRGQAHYILSKAGEEIGLDNIGCHSLRKTFGMHVYKKTNNLALVQKLLNHSSSEVTLRYLGIEKKQLDDVYLDLNL